MKANSEQEKIDRRILTDYLQEVYGKNISWASTMAKVKNLLKEYPFMSYNTIYYTLWYIINIESIAPAGDLIGLIPYYYDKAKEYNIQIESIKRAIDFFNWGNQKEQTVIRNIQEDFILEEGKDDAL